jgi:Flp pilus assembly protein TadD
VLQELGRLEEAEASCTQAIALKPDFAEAHSNLGQILFKKGQHREGLKAMLKGDGAITFSLKSGLSIL